MSFKNVTEWAEWSFRNKTEAKESEQEKQNDKLFSHGRKHASVREKAVKNRQFFLSKQ